MIVKDLATLKIHKMSRERYLREYEAGNIKDDEIYLVPDISEDMVASGIIDVVELPKVGMNERALYRLITASFIYPYASTEDWICKCVEELPEIGEDVVQGDPDQPYRYTYYNVSDGQAYGYYTEEAASHLDVDPGWGSLDAAMSYMWDTLVLITTNKQEAVDENGLCILLEYQMYHYKNGAWMKVSSSSGIDGDLDLGEYDCYAHSIRARGHISVIPNDDEGFNIESGGMYYDEDKDQTYAIAELYGYNADERVLLRRLAPGIDDHDAINKEQLDSAIQDLEDKITSAIGDAIGGSY